MTSPHKFVKRKIGIYCNDCMGMIENSDSLFNVNCSNTKCKKKFIPSIKSFLFCCKNCSFSRNIKDETRKKISLSVLNTIKSNKNINNNFNSESIYSIGNSFIINLIKDNFNFELTNRCCEYNHIFKPTTLSNNDCEKIWCPIEIKYSNFNIGNQYYFTMSEKTYPNALILCVNLKENKMWLFPPNIIKSCSKLKINILNKHTEYLVENKEKLLLKLYDFYHGYQSIHVEYKKNYYLDENKIFLNSHVQVEYTYKIKRLNMINFIPFQNPISNFELYNFIVNGYKVQECVCFISKKNNYQMASIHKIRDKKSLPFAIEDNDFYWFHERDCELFYVVPAKILELKGFISSNLSKGKTSINIDTNFVWLFDYKFSYQTINNLEEKTKLLKLFDLL